MTMHGTRHPDLSTTQRVMLVARGLAIGHRGHVVASAIDLTVHVGDWWALVGRNGAGKTTFVRTAIGDLPPVAGVCQINTDLVTGEALGVVPQRIDLAPGLSTSVREFVGLGLVGCPQTHVRRQQRIERALESCGLTALARRDVRTISGGERQRAALARAVVREPTLLILDEPTAALDEAAEASFLDLVAERHRSGMTVLWITHDVPRAAGSCTHAARFAAGTVEVGTAATVLAGRPT